MNKEENHNNQPSKGSKLNENPPREDGPNTDIFFNDTPTTEIYTPSNTHTLHDALPI